MMSGKLRVGALGLGRRWKRYRAVLAHLKDRFEVRCVADAAPARAQAEARSLGCAVAAGVLDLLGRDDLDAVFLVDRRWWGLWPLEQACRTGKPVHCAVPLTADDEHADEIASLVGQTGTMVQMAHPFFIAPALERLRALLAGPLGRAHMVRADLALSVERSTDLLRTASLSALLSICMELLGTRPERASALGDSAGRCVSVLLEGADGRAAQVTAWAWPKLAAHVRLQVAAEGGSASAQLPRRVCWRDAEGAHTDVLPRQEAELELLDHFRRIVTAGEAPRQGMAAALDVLSWVRAAHQSRRDGGAVSVGLLEPGLVPSA